MSRIGRQEITVPAGVTVEVSDSNVVTVKGKLGELKQVVDKCITVKSENGKVNLTRASDKKEHKAKHGLYRALINNMVIGVSQGFQKSLILNGVGYKAVKQGNNVAMNIGYSHQVIIEQPEGVTLELTSPTEILVKGIDKDAVGQCAANIRSKREPEPYHGYGIRYSDETIRRKEGKTAGK